MIIDFSYSQGARLLLEDPSEEAFEAFEAIQECLRGIDALGGYIDDALRALAEEADAESIVRLCHTGV
jgi:hypothetical protein